MAVADVLEYIILHWSDRAEIFVQVLASLPRTLAHWVVCGLRPLDSTLACGGRCAIARRCSPHVLFVCVLLGYAAASGAVLCERRRLQHRNRPGARTLLAGGGGLRRSGARVLNVNGMVAVGV